MGNSVSCTYELDDGEGFTATALRLDVESPPDISIINSTCQPSPELLDYFIKIPYVGVLFPLFPPFYSNALGYSLWAVDEESDSICTVVADCDLTRQFIAACYNVSALRTPLGRGRVVAGLIESVPGDCALTLPNSSIYQVWVLQGYAIIKIMSDEDLGHTLMITTHSLTTFYGCTCLEVSYTSPSFQTLTHVAEA